MGHELEEVVALSEDSLMLQSDRAGRVDALIGDGPRQLTLQARRERDQALAALAQQVLIHARTVVVALEVGRRHQCHEVLVADEVLGEEDEVPGLAMPFGPRIAVETVVAGDVRLEFAHTPTYIHHGRLDTDDRFDAGVTAERVEVDRAVEGAVIGESERRHVQRFRACDEVAEAGQPVEQAVLGMRVQMDEVLGDDLPHDVPLEEARRRFSEV